HKRIRGDKQALDALSKGDVVPSELVPRAGATGQRRAEQSQQSQIANRNARAISPSQQALHRFTPLRRFGRQGYNNAESDWQEQNAIESSRKQMLGKPGTEGKIGDANASFPWTDGLMADIDATSLARRACMLGLVTESQTQECYDDPEYDPTDAE